MQIQQKRLEIRLDSIEESLLRIQVNLVQLMRLFKRCVSVGIWDSFLVKDGFYMVYFSLVILHSFSVFLALKYHIALERLALTTMNFWINGKNLATDLERPMIETNIYLC